MIYCPNVEKEDRRTEICNAWKKIWKGFEPDPNTTICDGGITFRQYEKQCFYAERGIGEYPEPERKSLVRQTEREKRFSNALIFV